MGSVPWSAWKGIFQLSLGAKYVFSTGLPWKIFIICLWFIETCLAREERCLVSFGPLNSLQLAPLSLWSCLPARWPCGPVLSSEVFKSSTWCHAQFIPSFSLLRHLEVTTGGGGVQRKAGISGCVCSGWIDLLATVAKARVLEI